MPPPTPPSKRHQPIRTVGSLAQHLQWALSVELSTIPPYLTALYSVTDPAAPAARLVRSVAIEEMLHLMLVANLMNSIGTSPRLSGDAVPTYPGYIPHHAAGGPYIQLQPLTPVLARTTFMAIEQPEPSPRAPAEGDDFQTIGQFYKAIEEGFERCVERYGPEGVFGRDTGYQLADTYFGAGGGHLVVVHDLSGARRALQEIVEQGEGATHPRPPVPGEEPYGGYEHYGERLDGTFGPILGTPWELSHYQKFQQIADGKVEPPAVYPMRANPRPDELAGEARAAALLADGCYTLVLRALELGLGSRAGDAAFFGVAFPIMQDALPPLARLLMQTTLESAADPALGPTAGPAFRWCEVPLAALAAEARRLAAAPAPRPGIDYEQLWATALSEAARVLGAAERMAGAAERL